MKNQPNIVSVANDGYIAHFAAFLHSAWYHNKDANFFLLTRDISKKNKALLTEFATKKGIKLNLIEFESSALDAYKSDGGQNVKNLWSQDNWGRLLIPNLLPKSCKRAIYIDSDAVVIGDLSELFNSEMSQKPVAARDIHSKQSVLELLDFDETDKYVNSGMLLMDLDVWRKENLASKILKFGAENPQLLTYVDQCAINYILKGRIQFKSSKYNFLLDKPEYNDLNTPAIVVHYAGHLKPWNHPMQPCAELYFLHRNQTPWAVPMKFYNLTSIKNTFIHAWKTVFLNKHTLKNNKMKKTCAELFEKEYIAKYKKMN